MSTYTTALNLTTPNLAFATTNNRLSKQKRKNLSFAPPLSKSSIKLSATFSPAPSTSFLAGIETGSLNVPATKLAAGVARWLDLYTHVLTVRILLGWFPNIPWERQPFSAVRSLCDPYLNLFRNLVPMTGTLDFSSIIGFMVLATLSKILNTNTTTPF